MIVSSLTCANLLSRRVVKYTLVHTAYNVQIVREICSKSVGNIASKSHIYAECGETLLCELIIVAVFYSILITEDS